MRPVPLSILLIAALVANAAAQDEMLAERVQSLTKSSRWERVKSIPVQFLTFHPQGMTRVGERFYLSSVEVVDRRAGEGHAHLFEMDRDATLLRQVQLERGAMYHPGGLDFDGEYIWVSVAEYRPDSRSIVYRVDPETLQAEALFEFADHLGAVVHDTTANRLVGVSWGSRRYYVWEMDETTGKPRDAANPEMHPNGAHYIDYQDGQHLRGTPYALFSGLSRYRAPDAPPFALGGLELVDLRDLRPVHQVPVAEWAKPNTPMTQNPFYAEATADGLRVYFVPEDDTSTLYIYDVTSGL